MAFIETEEKFHPVTGEKGTYYTVRYNDGLKLGSTWDKPESIRLFKYAERIDQMESEGSVTPPQNVISGTVDNSVSSTPVEPEEETIEEPKFQEVGGQPIYVYIESTKPYYTIEMFIGDTGEDHEKIWKEAFIDKSTNFFVTAQPTSTETPDKADRSLAHVLYQKATAHGDAIAHTASGDIKGKADILISTVEETKEQRVKEATDKYVEEHTLTHDEAIKIVIKENEEKLEEQHTKNQQAVNDNYDDKKGENDTKRGEEENRREDQLVNNFGAGDKHCADGPDKVVSLVNNSVTDFIKKTAEQEMNRVKEATHNVEAYIEAKSKEEGEKIVTKKNNEILEVARKEVAMIEKAKQIKLVESITEIRTNAMKILGQLGIA